MRVILTLFAVLLLPSLGFAETIIVPDDFPTIQDAIDSAQNGDLVLVKPGTYNEQIKFKGRAITVRSDIDCIASTHDIAPEMTIIDADGTGLNDSVVKFTAGETASSVLDGFTLTNGTGAFDGLNYFGGGIFLYNSTPQILNNIIRGNTADFGGAIYCRNAAPTISGNDITLNTAADSGGGIMCIEAGANAEINMNTIRLNQAVSGGGGIQVEQFCTPVIFNNVIKFNTAADGGGIRCWSASAEIVNNLFRENAGENGAAVYCYTSAPNVTNNTFFFNQASGEGGGLHCFWNSFPAVTNNIFWANIAATDNEIHVDITSTPVVTYCNVQGGYAGTGNIDLDPLFLDESLKNLHLTGASPCIDAGDNAAASLGTMDFDCEPRQNGVVDMGFDESYSYPADELHVPAQYNKIQDAIDVAPPGATILVASKFQKEGSYKENLDFLGKDITVRSDLDADPLTHDIAPGDTLIDGRGMGSVVKFITGEASTSVLEGFTLTNGTGTAGVGGYYGGAVYCNLSSPTIVNNIIEENNTDYGGGIYCEDSSPIIEDNLIQNNSAGLNGGGIMCSESSPAINANIIKGNTSSFTGGGIDLFQYCSPDITNNIIHANSAADSGGGISCYRSTPLVFNNTIHGNSAMIQGGGIYCEYNSDITIRNCIQWMNTAPSGTEVSMNGFSSGEISHCDLMNGFLSVHEDPNSSLTYQLHLFYTIFDRDPNFEDPDNDVFHLAEGSWCIATGTNNGAPAFDIDGDARPFSGNTDIGADEFTGAHSLTADVYTLSAGSGGVINFSMDAGVSNPNRQYLLIPNITGCGAGTPLPGGLVVPLAWDILTDLSLVVPFIANQLGVLSASGTTAAALNAPPIPPVAVGFSLGHAFMLGNPFDFVSNIVNIEVVP